MKFSKDEKRVWLGQSHLIENMLKFCNCVKNVQSHKMPVMPKFLTVRPINKSEKISMEDQREYQSGIHMLLFLV